MGKPHIGQIMAECDCIHIACHMRKYCMAARIEALEAKLEKAVLALENIECEIMIDEEGSSGPSDAAREARATLAKITGETDDHTD